MLASETFFISENVFVVERLRTEQSQIFMSPSKSLVVDHDGIAIFI